MPGGRVMLVGDKEDVMEEWRKASDRLKSLQSDLSRAERDAERLRTRDIPEAEKNEKAAWVQVLALREEAARGHHGV